MSSLFKKKIGILTGGGDVQPLNAVIKSAIESAIKNNFELIGFVRGWQGVLENNFLILNNRKVDRSIGGTILKSSRVNLANLKNSTEQVKENLNKHCIDGLIIIGGEDTLSNSFYLKDVPQVLISKTIDNDVGIINDKTIINYFTLGYPTAAENISSCVSLNNGLRTTAYSHERIIVVESMGMHAGWLALSSCMGHPDFIIIPEFPLDYPAFLEKVIKKYNKQKNLIIVVAEGSRWLNGSYISADQNEKDSFEHPRFKGVANLLTEKMKNDLTRYFNTRNVNSVNPSYLYRSGKPNKLDLLAAKKLGLAAVNHFRNQQSESIFLTTNFNKEKMTIGKYPLSEVESIDTLHRFVTEQFYDHDQFSANKEGKKFLSKIIPEFPKLKYGL